MRHRNLTDEVMVLKCGTTLDSLMRWRWLWTKLISIGDRHVTHGATSFYPCNNSQGDLQQTLEVSIKTKGQSRDKYQALEHHESMVLISIATVVGQHASTWQAKYHDRLYTIIVNAISVDSWCGSTKQVDAWRSTSDVFFSQAILALYPDNAYNVKTFAASHVEHGMSDVGHWTSGIDDVNITLIDDNAKRRVMPDYSLFMKDDVSSGSKPL